MHEIRYNGVIYENLEGQKQILNTHLKVIRNTQKSVSNDLKFKHVVGMGKTNIQMKSESIWTIFERFTEL